MRYREGDVLGAFVVVLLLGLVVAWIVRLIHRASRKRLKPGESVPPPLPGGLVFGLLECVFYFFVLALEGAALLAGAWLAFKLATRWQSAQWAKPTELEVRIGYRAFQVGTLGNLLVGVIGAAILRLTK